MVVIKGGGDIGGGNVVKLQAFSGLTWLPASSASMSEPCCLQEFVGFRYVGKLN